MTPQQIEALKLALEALEQTLKTLDDENAKPGGAIADTIWHSEYETLFDYLGSKITAIKEALAQPEQEPVAWRDHVEQRLLTWRQSFVNRSGDQLALDDFMDKQSLDDLVNFVCDEYTTPPQRKPLINGEIYTAYITATNQTLRAQDERLAFAFARAIEAAHGIKENT